MIITAAKILFILGFLYLIIGVTKYRVEWADKLYVYLYKEEPPKSKKYTTLGILLFTSLIFIWLLHFLIGG